MSRAAPDAFVTRLAAAASPEAVLSALDGAVRARGAHGADCLRLDGEAPGDVRADDRSRPGRPGFADPLRICPAFGRDVRAAAARWERIDARPRASGTPDARFYDRLVELGVVASLVAPDLSPAGLREMRAIVVTLRDRPEDLSGWIDGPGAEIAVMAQAAIARVQALGPEERSPLTEREAEVLSLLAGGLRPARIAAEMGVSERTVEFHVAGARARLGARTRDAAVARAAARGWIAVP